MNASNSSRPALRWLAVGAGFATALYATHAAFSWLRYGRPASPASDETDQLLDQFIPAYEVVERHHVPVDAPADVTLAAACDMDISQSAIIRSIFKGRELVLGGHRDSVRRPQTLRAWATELGWGVLGQMPDREIVFGAVTRPWVANPVFRPVLPDEFASFREPGYAKIVWTLRADPISATESVARSETRVATTDPLARAAFRRYWSFFSPGIELIRWISLGLVKKEAERRMRAARQDRRSVESQEAKGTVKG